MSRKARLAERIRERVRPTGGAGRRAGFPFLSHILIAFVWISSSAGLCGPGENLLSNGGFEDGLTGWNAAPEHAIVTQEGAAHSGTACLSGEVTEPNKHLALRRTAAVRQGNLYRFEIWARATHGTKLTVWVIQPGLTQKEKENIATVKNVPYLWTRCEGTFVAQGTGDLELFITAPSSLGSPLGRMWVDDAALYEFEASESACVSQGVGFNDEPSMARAANGDLYIAWNSFRNGADTLQAARCRPQGEGFERLGAWEIASGGKGCILWPRAVAAGDKALVLYASETNGNWDIFAVPCGPDGPGQPMALTSDPAVDVKPVGAWRDGTLWVAWESNRNGPRQIFCASVRNGQVSGPDALSPEGCSSYSPSILALDSGQVCVAWGSFFENNNDIWLRRRSAQGLWEPERRLTRAPSIDRHPELFARGNELWIAYENAQMQTYKIGATKGRRLVAARVGPEGLEAPKSYAKTSPLYKKGEAAAPAFDASGRLWVAHLRSRDRDWDVNLAGFTGRKWEPLTVVSIFKGMDRRPSLALDGDRAFVAFQADNAPPRFDSYEAADQPASDICLASIDLSKAAAATALDLEAFEEPEEPFGPAEARLAFGEAAKTPTIEYKGKTLRLFYGDLHDHTEVSICNRAGDESIDESYENMRDIAGLDFACVTDHGYNLSKYLWAYTAKMARSNCDPGRFLTFLGEEWTSSFKEASDPYPYGFYGHRNLVFADPYFPRWWNERNRQTPAEVWEDLRKMNANFVHIPHQLADTGNVPVDWSFADEKAQPVAEIFQGRGSYEYKGAPREAKRTTPEAGNFIQDAWARGIVIGVIASPDHGGGLGKACVYAPQLSRESILEALRARHCFGTSAARIFLDVRVNGALMGEVLSAPDGKPVEVRIRVRCPADIECVEVCRNNEFIYANQPEGREADLTFTDTNPVDGWSYYYVRVTQKDKEMAWSSPVWLGRPDSAKEPRIGG